jgi:small subunit ribosomal protein S9
MAEERDDQEMPEGVPGEPGEATPEPTEETEAIGPEIEGMEELAAQSAGAAEEEPEAEEPAAEEPETEEPPAEAEPVAEEPEAEAPQADVEEPVAEAEEPGAEAAEPEPPRERRPRRDRRQDEPEEEVIPGMHLEPDLVLEEPPREESEYGQYAEAVEGYEGAVPEEAEEAEGEVEAPAEPEPVAHTPLDLAADARYAATGKRKSAVARVILRPGEGTYSINGRHLDEYFPRVRLQRMARQPLEAAGYQSRMDVVARIHGGGVSAQATALRHGVARALVEADPALRGELKRRGYLTRDPRVKERKKAGLKKARKRPQFSKR